jgi:hypothetical protein
MWICYMADCSRISRGNHCYARVIDRMILIESDPTPLPSPQIWTSHALNCLMYILSLFHMIIPIIHEEYLPKHLNDR